MRTVFDLILVVVLALASPALAVPRESDGIAVRSGNIVLKVVDYDQARSRLMQLARVRDAVLHEEKGQVNFAGKRNGNVVLEMDAAQLGPMMDDIRRIGKLYSEHVQTLDMTSDSQTLDRRISLLARNESELLGFLHTSRRMRGSDILFVQYRLFESRVQAANASQQRVDLSRRAQKALLDVALFEPEPRKTFDWGNWRAVAAYRAKGSVLYVTRKAFTAFFFVAYFAPYWIPAALVVFFGGRRVYRWIRRIVTGLWDRRRVTSAPAEPEAAGEGS